MPRYLFSLERPDPIACWWLGHLDDRALRFDVQLNDEDCLITDYDGEVIFKAPTTTEEEH